MAIDTSGFNLSVPQVSVTTPALASLAPLSMPMQGMAWKPADIREPSSAVAEGVASALGSIGKGITAAYQNARAQREQEKRDALAAQKEARGEALSSQKEARTEAMQNARLGLEFQKEKAYEAALRIRSSTPSKGKTVDFGQPDENLSNAQKEYYQGVESGDQSPLPGEDPLAAPDANEIQLDNNPLGSLTAPVPYSPEFKTEDLPQMLSQVPASQLSASSIGVPPMADLKPPINFADPNAAKNALSNIGFDQIHALFNSSGGGAKLEAAMAPKPAVVPPHPIKHAFRTEEEAWKEAQRDISGWQPGDVEKVEGVDPATGNTTVGYVAKRKQVDPRLAATEAYRKTVEGQREEQLRLRQQNLFNNERTQFYNTPQIKVFLGPNGMQQSFSRFMADYDKVQPGSPGAGISQLGLLDMFARAESGGRVTEAQADLALKARSIGEKWETLFNSKFGGGDVLSKPQMEQMRNVMMEDYAKQAKFANQAVKGHQAVLQDQGVTRLPTEYIMPVSREEGENTVDWYKSEIPKLKMQLTDAKTRGDQQSASQIESQLEQYGAAAMELRNRIDKSKSSIINLEDIENEPQGWFGAAAKKKNQ